MNVKKKVGWRCSAVGRVLVCHAQGLGAKPSTEKKKMGEEGKEGEKEEEEEEVGDLCIESFSSDFQGPCPLGMHSTTSLDFSPKCPWQSALWESPGPGCTLQLPLSPRTSLAGRKGLTFRNGVLNKQRDFEATTVESEGPVSSKCDERHRGLAVATQAGSTQWEEVWEHFCGWRWSQTQAH